MAVIGTFPIHCPTWGHDLQGTLYKMRSTESLVDVTIIAAGQVLVEAHSIVLAAGSPYLLARFASLKKGIYTLRTPDIRKETWDLLLSFIYTGSVKVPFQELLPLRAAARKLQLDYLQTVCDNLLPVIGVPGSEVKVDEAGDHRVEQHTEKGVTQVAHIKSEPNQSPRRALPPGVIKIGEAPSGGERKIGRGEETPLDLSKAPVSREDEHGLHPRPGLLALKEHILRTQPTDAQHRPLEGVGGAPGNLRLPLVISKPAAPPGVVQTPSGVRLRKVGETVEDEIEKQMKMLAPTLKHIQKRAFETVAAENVQHRVSGVPIILPSPVMTTSEQRSTLATVAMDTEGSPQIPSRDSEDGEEHVKHKNKRKRLKPRCALSRSPSASPVSIEGEHNREWVQHTGYDKPGSVVSSASPTVVDLLQRPPQIPHQGAPQATYKRSFDGKLVLGVPLGVDSKLGVPTVVSSMGGLTTGATVLTTPGGTTILTSPSITSPNTDNMASFKENILKRLNTPPTPPTERHQVDKAGIFQTVETRTQQVAQKLDAMPDDTRGTIVVNLKKVKPHSKPQSAPATPEVTRGSALKGKTIMLEAPELNQPLLMQDVSNNSGLKLPLCIGTPPVSSREQINFPPNSVNHQVSVSSSFKPQHPLIINHPVDSSSENGEFSSLEQLAIVALSTRNEPARSPASARSPARSEPVLHDPVTPPVISSAPGTPGRDQSRFQDLASTCEKLSQRLQTEQEYVHKLKKTPIISGSPKPKPKPPEPVLQAAPVAGEPITHEPVKQDADETAENNRDMVKNKMRLKITANALLELQEPKVHSPASVSGADSGANESPPQTNKKPRSRTRKKSSSGSDDSSKKGRFVCKICPKSYSQRSHLLIHARKHTGERPYPCPQCPKTFRQKATLMSHSRVHSGERPYKCDFCEKTFTQSGNKIVHQRTHFDDKPFKCKYCNKAFARKETMVVHEKVHTGEKPHVCEVCDKSFTQRANLRVHERIHNGDKPFECKQCDKKFLRKESLQQHERIHDGKRPFVCRFCTRSFSQRGNRDMHERRHRVADEDGVDIDEEDPLLEGVGYDDEEEDEYFHDEDEEYFEIEEEIVTMETMECVPDTSETSPVVVVTAANGATPSCLM